VGPIMAEKLDPNKVITFEELLRACLYDQEALRRVLVRRGLVINEEAMKPLPSMDLLHRLAKALKVEVGELLK